MDEPTPKSAFSWPQMKTLCKALLLSKLKPVLYVTLIAQLAVALLVEIVGYLTGLISSKFYLVLGQTAEDRSMREFTNLVIYSAVLMLVIAFLKSTKQFTTGIVNVLWREHLTSYLHEGYFKAFSTSYKINLSSNLDNVDQRIATDSAALVKDLSQMIPTLLVSPFTIGYYTYRCQTVTGWLGPVSVFGFFIITTIINILLMRPVKKLVYEQDRQEGNFRYNHMMIRVNCESSAFSHYNHIDCQTSTSSFSVLLTVMRKLVLWRFLQNFFINLCDYSVSILSYMIVAIPIFRGDFDLKPASELSSLISAYSYQSIYLFQCFTQLIDLAAQSSILLGNCERITDLIDGLAELDKPASGGGAGSNDKKSADIFDDLDEGVLIPNTAASSSTVNTVSSYEMVPLGVNDTVEVVLDNLCVEVPNTHRLLINNLNYTFKKGENVLITGSSGIGKSSLFRVIGRLWSPRSGRVSVCGRIGYNHEISIIPQRPYLTTGTLLYQIDLGCSNITEDQVRTTLNALNLEHLVVQLKQHSQTWYDRLTPGEAQRICIARILLNKPQLVFLDESTSQLDLNSEKIVYTLLKNNDISYVSIAHRESLRQYHTTELHITDDSSVQITSINTL